MSTQDPDDQQIPLLSNPEEDATSADGTAGDVVEEVTRVDWSGEEVDFSEAMLDRGHAYGSYVNTSRAIPDVRDGLKPVQRRIIFAMDELGSRADRPYKKSATTVGHVIGNYHPHGDSAVYDAMVRMAQDFQSTTPLVDGQGNWGNVDGDPAAAMRYTEARLTALASECIVDLRPEVVDYRENFSETRQEATVLPVTVPLVLTLGQSGIGWSMASDIPPHSVGEAIDAAIVVAKRPNPSLADVMKVMPGPDFPGGGVVTNPEGLAQIYATGQGTIQLQGRYIIESLPGNQQAVLLTELPYQVGPDQIVKQVVQAARDGRITDVVEMPRNLTGRNTGPRVQVKCKRGGNVQKLIADLMRFTKLRDTVKFNFTVIADGKPRQLPLIDILRRFVAFRHEVVARRLRHEAAVLARDLHRLLALMAALSAIDEVVAIIRSADDDDDAKARLIATLTFVAHGERVARPIDDQQATWIIEMQLRRLNKLNRFRLQDEVRAKGDRTDEIAGVLESEHGVRDIVIDELRAAKARYGVPRRTVLAATGITPSELTLGAEADVRAPTPAGGSVAIYIADLGQVLVADPNVRRLPRVPLQPAAGAAVIGALDVRADLPLVAVTAGGFAFRVNPIEGPPETRRGRGQQLVSPAKGDRIVAVLPESGGYSHCALVTASGQIKRVEWGLLGASHAAGALVFRVGDGDRIVACVLHPEDGGEILVATAGGQLLRTALGAIRPVQSGSAGGIAGMKVAAGDRVVCSVLASGDDVLTVHRSGSVKRTALAEYPAKGRGTGGVASADPHRPTKEPAGDVSLIACVARGGGLVLVTARGESIEIGADDVEPVARSAVSRPLVEIADGDRPSILLVTER